MDNGRNEKQEEARENVDEKEEKREGISQCVGVFIPISVLWVWTKHKH